MDAVASSFEPLLLLALMVAVLLAVSAQVVLRLTMRRAGQLPARISGFATARAMLDAAGLEEVTVEQVPGPLSDYYDPQHRVVRLSGPVYHGRTQAAIGIAAHETGHALQHAAGDSRVGLLGVAGIAAGFGSGAGLVLILLSIVFGPLLWFGAAVFCGAVCIQLLNLPAEFNATRRAKRALFDLDIVGPGEFETISPVMYAATLNYLAGTIQTVLAALARLLRYMSRGA